MPLHCTGHYLQWTRSLIGIFIQTLLAKCDNVVLCTLVNTSLISFGQMFAGVYSSVCEQTDCKCHRLTVLLIISSSRIIPPCELLAVNVIE
jgi:hypothetical protein